jgi:hypothetical protein
MLCCVYMRKVDVYMYVFAIKQLYMCVYVNYTVKLNFAYS